MNTRSPHASRWRARTLAAVGALALGLSMVAANTAAADAESDPREGLSAGVHDAGQAASNIALLSAQQKTDPFTINSDLAFTGDYAIAGNYYGFQIYDISDPAAPREVSRVTLGPDDVPHWISMSKDRRRVVVTGYGGMKHRVVIARFDSATGRLALDERFREPGASAPGFRMDDKTWPHGGNAKGIPHGSVFGRP